MQRNANQSKQCEAKQSNVKQSNAKQCHVMRLLDKTKKKTPKWGRTGLIFPKLKLQRMCSLVQIDLIPIPFQCAALGISDRVFVVPWTSVHAIVIVASRDPL